MVIEPLQPSFKRWRELAFSSKTLLRALEYERLRNTVLPGRVLDVGGGSLFSYTNLFKVEGTVEAINISDQVGAKWLADLNQPLPFADASFDCVISMNTLEHIREDAQLLGEMVRVLRGRGKLIITVPFLYRVHGSPHDYHRHTSQWWQSAFAKLGFGEADIRIEPLVWGSLSSGLAQFPWFRAGMFGGTLKKLVLLLELLWPRKRRDATLSDYALGYAISASKPA